MFNSYQTSNDGIIYLVSMSTVDFDFFSNNVYIILEEFVNVNAATDQFWLLNVIG